MGLPGSIDFKHGICLTWPNVPGWKGVPLRNLLREAFASEVILDDRSHAIALAEHRSSGEGARHPNAMYVNVGAGVGAGLIIRGRLFRGSVGTAGEIGHLSIDPDGPVCGCGKKGCVEAYSSTQAVLREFRDALAGGALSPMRVLTGGDAPAATIEMVAAAATQGDRVALKVLHKAAKALGTGISYAVKILNPSLVVLCGRLSQVAGQHVLPVIWSVLREECSQKIWAVNLRLATFKKDNSTIGCAFLGADAFVERLIRERIYG